MRFNVAVKGLTVLKNKIFCCVFRFDFGECIVVVVYLIDRSELLTYNIHACVTGKKAIGVCSCMLILCCMVLHMSLSLLTLIKCRRRTVLITSPRSVSTCITS